MVHVPLQLALMAHVREVFTNAPLAFVVCEIRFPQAPQLVHDESFIALTEAFAEELPIPQEERLEDGSVRRFRFLDKRHMLSVVVARDALSIETTDYSEWGHFKPVVLRAVDVIASTARITGTERVGLRYINEIRVPETISEVSDWRGWINDGVLSPLGEISGYSADSFQTVTRLTRDSSHLNVVCAALVGNGVVSDQPLRRRVPAANGAFFVIDTDSYRETPGEGMDNFTAETLEPTLEDLHAPLQALFHRAITEESRKLFRRSKR